MSTRTFSIRLPAIQSSIDTAPPVAFSQASRMPGFCASLRSFTTCTPTRPLLIRSTCVVM